jgi:enediyne biosynthesis protein E5
MSATTVNASSPVATPQSEARQPKLFGIDSRFVAPIFITFILLVGQLTYGILESYAMTVLAILTAIALELVLGRVYAGRWPHLASAYISGISVGILTRSPFAWPFALCSAISIASKYVLRVRGRHIWNPSNFGICLMLLVAPWAFSTLSVQWGNNLWPVFIIWALGLVITYHVGRIHITLTYVASFFALAFVRSLLTGHTFLAEAAPITGPMYQLFIFFMITDPKTTVRSSKLAQGAVAFAVALVETILRLFENVHAPYYALFIAGPLANLIEIYLTRSKVTATPSVEPAT